MSNEVLKKKKTLGFLDRVVNRYHGFPMTELSSESISKMQDLSALSFRNGSPISVVGYLWQCDCEIQLIPIDQANYPVPAILSFEFYSRDNGSFMGSLPKTLMLRFLKEGFGYPVGTILSIGINNNTVKSYLARFDNLDVKRYVGLSAIQVNKILEEWNPTDKYFIPKTGL